MSDNFGIGVSRVLDPTGTQYTDVIFEQGKPICDAELNLIRSLCNDFSSKLVLRGAPSGWLGNETNSNLVYLTNPAWSNWFQFGQERGGEQASIQWAQVNGWLIPVAGTRTGTPPGSPDNVDTYNIITLDPPPSNAGDFRTDFIYLEAWLARIPPNPSSLNKPSATAVWKLGNVEGGMSYLTDDLVDPAIGMETTQRVQLQYRIRVVKGLVGLTSSPDGFDPTVVKAQGAASAPTSFVFTNMRQTLGDPGLWRAGDGTQNSLGTVDGYVYAIPMCGVFRRNSVTWLGDPSPNLNGAFNRNPTALDRTGIATFSTTATLALDLSATATVAQIATATGIPLPTNPASDVLIRIGDEYLTYHQVTLGTPPTLAGFTRGLNGSRAELHRAGSTVQILSGRPDGLFADQIAKTDILDLRHGINPNGFDYPTLLKTNLDRLLRGQLQANWKRSGSGPQGPFVFYQDKISSGAVALGVTKVDGPDSIRMVFSDAAVTQKVTVILTPNTNSLPTPVNAAWDLALTATQTVRASGGYFSPTDSITIPVNQLKIGLPGGDADQVRWVNDGVTQAVVLRVDGENNPRDPSTYVVTPANPGSTDDLVITLGAGFTQTSSNIYATLNIMYGPGRGLSRRPGSLHSVNFINPSSRLLLSPIGNPGSNLPTRTAWAPLWSRSRKTVYKNLLPVTADTYADLGSKTAILTPFQSITWPNNVRIQSGSNVNTASAAFYTGVASGVGNGTTTFQCTTGGFSWAAEGTIAGDIVQIGNLKCTVVSFPLDVTKVVLDTVVLTGSGLSFKLYHTQGIMPSLSPTGASKWGTTDPLTMFLGRSGGNAFVNLPREMVPGWGEVRAPILPVDNTTFSEGINYICLSTKAATSPTDPYVSYLNGGLTYAVFSTYNTTTSSPVPYNTVATVDTVRLAGMRFFTDSRGLGRQGLELPPFYGISRLFAVYEVNDYFTNGSAYTSARIARGTGAINLLRQNMDPADGPPFWVELDSDGDSTFILNAKVLDISRSPNPIANFASGNYVIESSIFGFDRGSFDLNQDFRLILAADNTTGLIGRTMAGPVTVLPGPAAVADQIVANYSRTPYQGDAWGSQTSNTDITYLPGPVTSANAYQIASTQLTLSSLTRPNPKSLEVLASIGFATTAGTGHLSGDVDTSNPLDYRDAGYEDPTAYPPTSGVEVRPRTLTNAVGDVDVVELGTEYLGCTERLPLGSLFRDKDFRGQQFSLPGGVQSSVVYFEDVGEGAPGSLAQTSLEQTEISLDTATTGMASPGDALVQVDGEPGNYALLTNFRVNRGGSVFFANGRHPGGELSLTHPAIHSSLGHANVIEGRAYLVRNAPTSVGVNEVSAGSELMLLVTTTVNRLTDTNTHPGTIIIGTNGSGEGYSAADLYRIEGHPLVSDNVRYQIPTTLNLTPGVL